MFAFRERRPRSRGVNLYAQRWSGGKGVVDDDGDDVGNGGKDAIEAFGKQGQSHQRPK